MGFDLNGLNPSGKENVEAVGPSGFFDESAEQQWKADAQAGISFRNNVWYWRPLWEYVAQTCDDILTLKDYRYGQSNDGHIINAEKAIAIGERLRETISDYNKIVERIEANIKSSSESYTFEKENVEEFANFCINSGGFSIW